MPTLEQRRRYNENYKTADPERYAAYRKKNLERIKAKYREDHEWRERKKEYAAKRWREKKDEIKARRRANPKTAEYNTKYNTSAERRSFYRRRLLMQKHGLTVEQFDELFARQNNVCAICSSPPGLNPRWKDKSAIRNLKIDHDHETGAVRGLLCHNCNVAIGLLKDSPNLFRRAADYLEWPPYSSSPSSTRSGSSGEPQSS